jgi:apolipoprotein N-acyltransferase
MIDAAVVATNTRKSAWLTLALANAPSLTELSLATASALLIVLSFPNFELSFMAWVGLAPLLVAIIVRPNLARAFLLGLWWGTIFFYGTCWWLTYSMIRYGHFRPWLAYPLLLLPVLLVALIPAFFSLLFARLFIAFGKVTFIVAPFLWATTELVRYGVTGQLWNALGYSQAFHAGLIQSARWGGVYAVSFLLVSTNAALAALIIKARPQAMALLTMAAVLGLSSQLSAGRSNQTANQVIVIAVQPNVPMDLEPDDVQRMNALLDRHLEVSTAALNGLANDAGNSLTRLVIWPESPMYFRYSGDQKFRDLIGNFARTNRTNLLFNAIEPAPDGGDYNSAILINQEGQKVAQYDKIRLMPFGEYVPLPRWIPGASSVRGLVGDFSPGTSYTLMPLGAVRAGVFICIEAAHPSIARTFTDEGADVLINISNDGYLGPTAVMRQHLSNAIFRALENDRQLIRVTNTGITADLDSSGAVKDVTSGFQSEIKTWTISSSAARKTFYTRHGDFFVYACALISLGFVTTSFRRRRLVKGKNRER